MIRLLFRCRYAKIAKRIAENPAFIAVGICTGDFGLSVTFTGFVQPIYYRIEWSYPTSERPGAVRGGLIRDHINAIHKYPIAKKQAVFQLKT
jgi:hypothetical protein